MVREAEMIEIAEESHSEERNGIREVVGSIPIGSITKAVSIKVLEIGEPRVPTAAGIFAATGDSCLS